MVKSKDGEGGGGRVWLSFKKKRQMCVDIIVAFWCHSTKLKWRSIFACSKTEYLLAREFVEYRSVVVILDTNLFTCSVSNIPKISSKVFPRCGPQLAFFFLSFPTGHG